ncbi:MAG: phenylacetic acid degradation bifunctional protein PaaZ [Bacteroidia bacterium]|nr:phenylacetic acid degradation bifunctional protein PaaZ [Bacteroidia bacterium]
MEKIKNYICGQWVAGSGNGQELVDAVTGETIGFASTEGIDFQVVADYARRVGGTALRKMTFQERGRMLKSLALHLLSKKEEFYKISYRTGATRTDSWIDIEGGIGNLFSYASLRRQFPDLPYTYEGNPVKLSKNNTFIGHHICVPKEGVAIHINAFNFPVWGMLEKVAVNWLAGVPAIVKPATATSYLAEAVAKEIIASGIIPEGALQVICGNARNLLEVVMNQDVVTFTGSASTGKMLKSHPKLVEESVPFNMEADSLNACVLGKDVTPQMPEFEIFIKEVAREITVKAGQKCTAVRRILVPEHLVEDVRIALGNRLSKIVIGNPMDESVRMGALAGKPQLQEVLEKVELLSRTQKIIIGDFEKFEIKGADKSKGAFMPPVVFLNEKPFEKTDCHNIEAFGPVSTLIPYKTTEEAIELVKMGKGSLVTSIVTADNKIAREFTLGTACMHGRILILNNECAKESTGHGSPLPGLVHGGPGRAGGGEEMGGVRGVFHYMQRTAIQGSPTVITEITQQYQYGARQVEKEIHPFRQYFEDLEIGETLITAKHTVTEADIVNFANISGDHFYAHTDVTSLDGTIFTGRVAHGYYILSKAAGLFVNAKKGPVLLNYGIDECRFTKPVYVGTTIGVRFTCKEKIEQEKKTPDDIAKGIVKWLVDVYDDAGDTVAIATILTMVKKRNQD